MSKTEMLEGLFANWRKQMQERGYPIFVSDGIVCEEQYEKARVKVLFILKEMPFDEGGNEDYSLNRLMERIVSKRIAHSNFSGRLALWSYGILNGLPPWAKVEKIWEISQKKEVLEALRCIAVMNMKKAPGGKSSNQEDLKKVLKRDWDFLSREIQIINPTLLVCCGVWHLWKEELGVVDFETAANGFQWFEFSLEDSVPRKFLNFPHPSRPIESSIMYSHYIDGIRSDARLNTLFIEKT